MDYLWTFNAINFVVDSITFLKGLKASAKS